MEEVVDSTVFFAATIFKSISVFFFGKYVCKYHYLIPADSKYLSNLSYSTSKDGSLGDETCSLIIAFRKPISMKLGK